MLSEDLLTFVKEELDHLCSLYPELYQDLEKRIYAQTIKLGEEYGEFNEAILDWFKRQRKSKTNKTINLGEEAVDIIMVTLLICEGLGIDVNAALQSKITKLKSRRALDL